MFLDTEFVLRVCPGDILQLLRAVVCSPTHPSILPTVGSPKHAHHGALNLDGICLQDHCDPAEQCHGRTDTKPIFRKHSLMKAMLMQKMSVLSGLFVVWSGVSSLRV